MLQRVWQTLRRRERLLHVRELLQQQAEQALAAVLGQEEGLKQERTSLENAEERSRSAMFDEMDREDTVPSAVLLPYVHRLTALVELAQQKDREIVSLAPRIQQSRQEVVGRHRAKRAMEILTDKAREQVSAERVRAEQHEQDALTSQRFRGRHAIDGSQT